VKILAIDTSSRTLCLGVSDSDKVYEYNLELGIRISALLAPTILRAVNSLGWKISEIDYFCAGIGPGSFTGLRVGLAAVKALSWSLNKPVVGISSLDILAQNSGKDSSFIIPVIDAKRGMVYASIYKNRGGQISRVAAYMLLDSRELALKVRKKVSAKALRQSVILGDGLNICSKECFALLKGIKVLDKDYWRLEARNLIALAKLAIQKKRSSNAFSLKPLYLYPKECQIKNYPLHSK
jgi:tRNA threonylcarbamoyladenosine biosynthesis protein TsaB